MIVTVTVYVTYKRGSQVSYDTFVGTGTDEKVVTDSVMKNINKRGWRVVDVDIKVT